MSGKTERVLARAGESVNRLIGRVLQPPALMQADALAELRAIPDSVLKVLTPEQRDARTIILNMADGGVPLEYGIGEQVDRLGYPPAVAAYARDCASVATTDVPGCRSDIWAAHRVLETDRLADHLKDANGNPAVVAEVTAQLVALGEVSAAAEPLLTAFEEDWFDTPDVPCPCALSGAFPLNDTSILQGKGGFGKSFLSLQFLLSVAIGRELVRGYVPEHGPKPVAFVTLEDRKQSVLERAKKIARAYSFTPEERRLVARNFTIKAQGPPFVPVVRRPDDGTLRAGPDLLRLSGELKKLRPAMVVLDPIASLLGPADENANSDARAVGAILTHAMPPDCALLLVAHVSKAQRQDGTALTPRGAQAWEDAARFTLGLRPPTNGEKSNAGDNDIVVLENEGKHNHLPKRPTQYLVREPFRAGVPDKVGVLMEFNFTAAQRKAEQEADARVEQAILEVVATFPDGVTKKELIGNAETVERKNHGNEARLAIGELLGYGKPMPVARLRELLDSMIGRGVLWQTGDGRGGKGERRLLRVKPVTDTGDNLDSEPVTTGDKTSDNTGYIPVTDGPPLRGDIEAPPLGVARPSSVGELQEEELVEDFEAAPF
ncbi:MAG TPA: AAA family ATPase [Candidatus Hydrogenedentes bacterium]|nr:AAA family ATPase [Candidatus Hydrogenedentota bacterium]